MTCFFVSFLTETLGPKSRSMFGPNQGTDLESIAEASAEENELLRSLATKAGLPFTVEYPVSFGTHIELSGDEDVPSVKTQVLKSGIGRVHPELVEPLVVENDWWGIGESISISFEGRGEPDAKAEESAPMSEGAELLALRPGERIQIIEALALRYGTLLSIQRNTQLEFIKRSKSRVDASQLASWEKAVFTTTDDWAFAGRVGRHLSEIESGLDSGRGSRSTLALRDQVNENLSMLQAKLERASRQASMILGLVFSIVAARGISSMILLAVSGGRPEDWRNDHVWEAIGIEVGVIAILGLAVFSWFRRTAGHVPKFWNR